MLLFLVLEFQLCVFCLLQTYAKASFSSSSRVHGVRGIQVLHFERMCRKGFRNVVILLLLLPSAGFVALLLLLGRSF